MKKEFTKVEAEILRDLVDNYVEQIQDTRDMTQIYYKLNEIVNTK